FPDLVTNRARDSVRRGTVLLVGRRYRQMLKDFCLLSLGLRGQVRDRHMTNQKFILNIRLRLGMTQRSPPHASLPVGIARGVRHDAGPPLKSDGNIFAGTGLQFVMTSNASVGGAKLLVQGL